MKTHLISIGSFIGIATQAAVISISNPSFEDTSGQFPNNEFTFGIPVGWAEYNPSNLVRGSGLYIGTLEPDGTFFDPSPNFAPDGDRVALLYNQTSKGAGEYGIEQTLPDTLQPLTQYTLQVEVGNIGSGIADGGAFYDLDGFPGYRIDLFAGTNLVASDHNSLLIPERIFSNAVLQVITGANQVGVGEPLMIRLVSLNNPLEPDDNSAPFDAHEVDFDHVLLNTEFVPELFSTSNGASYAILLLAGLVDTNASVVAFESASLINTDGDIHWDWQEYITGSDPSNSASFVTSSLIYTNEPTLTWPSISNRNYSVSFSTHLNEGFIELTNGLSSGGYVHLDQTNSAGFYRVEVQLP